MTTRKGPTNQTVSEVIAALPAEAIPQELSPGDLIRLTRHLIRTYLGVQGAKGGAKSRRTMTREQAQAIRAGKKNPQC